MGTIVNSIAHLRFGGDPSGGKIWEFGFDSTNSIYEFLPLHASCYIGQAANPFAGAFITDLTIGDDLIVTDDAAVGGDLVVTGAASAATVAATTTVTAGTNLVATAGSVSAATTVTAGTNLVATAGSVSAATDVSGATLTISGAATAVSYNHSAGATKNDMTATVTGVTLSDGAVVTITPAITSDGVCTLDVNGLGAKKIMKGADGTTQVGEVAGEVTANVPFTVVYNTALDTAAGAWVHQRI